MTAMFWITLSDVTFFTRVLNNEIPKDDRVRAVSTVEVVKIIKQ